MFSMEKQKVCNNLYYRPLSINSRAPCRNRTSDLLITSQLLYQLS